MPGFDRLRIVGLSEKDLDEFTCGICQEIFNDPVVTQCCRQTYCKTCIEEWLSTHTTCPNDRKILRINDLIPAPRFAVNFLSNIRIKCDFEEKGCEVITTIGEIHKHLENCVHKLDINCKTCGLPKINDEEHNCITNLVIKNSSIVDEMYRLQKQNQSLKSQIQNMTLGMTAVLNSVRNTIGDYKIGEPILRINSFQKRFLIESCQDAILQNGSFVDICKALSSKVNSSSLPDRGPKRWQVVAFTPEGGESWVDSDQYFRIEFDMLIIECFTAMDPIK